MCLYPAWCLDALICYCLKLNCSKLILFKKTRFRGVSLHGGFIYTNQCKCCKNVMHFRKHLLNRKHLPCQVFGCIVNPGYVFLGDGQVGPAAEEDAVARKCDRVLRRLLEPQPDVPWRDGLQINNVTQKCHTKTSHKKVTQKGHTKRSLLKADS